MTYGRKSELLADIVADDIVEAYIKQSKNGNNKSGEENIPFCIMENYGTLSNGKNAITFALVDWDGIQRYDLRRWNEDYSKPFKGLSLTKEEVVRMKCIFDSHIREISSCPQKIYENGKARAKIYQVIGTLSSTEAKGTTWNKQICLADWGYGIKYDFRRWSDDYKRCSKGLCIGKTELKILLSIIETLDLENK